MSLNTRTTSPKGDAAAGRLYGRRGARPVIRCAVRGKWWQLWRPLHTVPPSVPTSDEMRSRWAARYYLLSEDQRQ